MNLAAARINEVEKSLDDARKLHQKFVAQFTSNLSIAKSKVRDNQIKNGECFYLTMREGKSGQNWCETICQTPADRALSLQSYQCCKSLEVLTHFHYRFSNPNVLIVNKFVRKHNLPTNPSNIESRKVRGLSADSTSHHPLNIILKIFVN